MRAKVDKCLAGDWSERETWDYLKAQVLNTSLANYMNYHNVKFMTRKSYVM